MTKSSNGHVSGERRAVGEHDAVADRAVVRDVREVHEQVAVAHRRRTPAALRADVHGRELANLVLVADHQASRFAAILEILGDRADAAN